MTAKELIDIYISFFEKRGHKRIANSPLVPENDPTTLFTSSGMQPLIQYLLGETHPAGNRLVDVQNSFRAQDIDEVGDNRHTTFFRMLGNWSLGDYFKTEEIPWLFEFLTKEFGLPKEKLFITVFAGNGGVERDNEAFEIWKKIVPEDKIFFAGVDKNWWSRSGVPDNMPIGEPGGPDSEVYFKFDDIEHNKDCKDNPVDCECGKFLEIANAVFMQYIKTNKGFENLPKQNVDFGGGLERLLAAVEEKSDVFATSLFTPIIKTIEKETGKQYRENAKEMQIISDHFAAGVFIISAGVLPANKERGYILRRLIRRAFDNFYRLKGKNIEPVLEKIVEQYSQTDEVLQEKYEEIKLTILEEEAKYKSVRKTAVDFIVKKYPSAGSGQVGDDSAKPVREISADDAFLLYTTHGLSPTQIRSLGYAFNEQDFAKKMEEHQKLSRTASSGMFKGGLADHSELTIMGHTATHLLHQALRDVFGSGLHQTGSNITTERVRFDFNLDRNLTAEELKKVEDIVNQKIEENLPVRFEIMPVQKAKDLGAVGLFDEKYAKDVKVYFIGNYSREFCGGPHVDFTGVLKRFKILKQENIGYGQRRIYAVVNK
ncbi:MAG: alanine--tRNA ligase [Patescibacteria group bacterium]|nr:alanine--tRNA ligase [Patescibacteria group bacterium]